MIQDHSMMSESLSTFTSAAKGQTNQKEYREEDAGFWSTEEVRVLRVLIFRKRDLMCLSPKKK
jgi:hypothetical protein